jgi:hypothetical protein
LSGMKNVSPNMKLLFSVVVSRVYSHRIRLPFISILLLFLSVPLFAQNDPPMPDDVAPPPLKIISKEEKDQLAGEAGIKGKSALYITLLDERLKRAEDSSTKENFTDALTQFGVYQGLLESMMGFLKDENKSNKALGSFKKLELTLRAHIYRIETVRREMPFKYAWHVTRLQKYVRKSRAEATESLFSDSVVPEAAEEKKP